MNTGTYVTLALVLGGEFVNGWTDAPNATAAAVATKLLSKKAALRLAVVLNFAGTLASLFFGAAVAKTIGTGIVDPSAINLDTINAAMCAVIAWGVIAGLKGLPVSKSHALFAGLAGAALAVGGFGALLGTGWLTILKGVGISTVLVFSAALAVSWLVRLANPDRIPEEVWRGWQVLTVCLVAFGHGWNDGLKFIGVFALVRLLGHDTATFIVEPWTIVLCAFVMGLGTYAGGWSIVQRIGQEMVKNGYLAYQGVLAELIAALGIAGTALGGIPMSTTHTVVSSIAGAKASRGFKEVDWGTVGVIVRGWILTIVFCAPVAFIFSFVQTRLL